MKRHLLCLAFGLLTAAPAAADIGAYLAGRHAMTQHDYEQAAGYLSSALLRDPTNQSIQLLTMQANLAAGSLDQAFQIASWIDVGGDPAPLVNLVGLADDLTRSDYARALERLDAGTIAGSAMDGLIRGWALMGLGDVRQALDVFDETANSGGVQAFALTHKALALASVGDFEQARQIFEGDGVSPGIAMTERAMIAYAQILVQLDDRETASVVLRQRFQGTDNAAALSLAAAIDSGAAIGFDFVQSPQDGIAEVFFTVALALRGETESELLLLHARIANGLNPDHAEALILAASFLDELGNSELATVAYDKVPRTHPAYLRAELGRAAALETSEEPTAAIEVLSQLNVANPNIRRVQMALADLLRREKNYAAAFVVYDDIISQIQENGATDWFVYFARAVASENIGNWDAAERDFRQSIALDPNQAVVLNYLGYSFVDRGENLEEALSLIERADVAAPGRGPIIDSLGWAHYRMGNYVQAVMHLERAVEAMPTDPIINDHLGDAFWKVGRKVEADFQWRRALSFDPEETDANRIHRKIAEGLDAVLADEPKEELLVKD